MVYCSAVDCKSDSSRKNEEQDISFFRLPRNVNLKRKWTSALNRVNLPKEDNVRICHLHFKESCFERDMNVRSIKCCKLRVFYFI